MQLKIKVCPKDFIVKEIVSLPLIESGAYGVYLLEKYGWNTIDLLLEISRRLNLSFECLSYGGRKDRYALTTQHIAIKSPEHFSLKESNYSLKFVGFMDRPMGPDLIKANEFRITIRKLSIKDIEYASTQIEKVSSIGYPNYFDDQRFGCFDKRLGFWAEKILKKQFNGALKIYLTSVYPGDKKDENQRKRFFFENWRDWQACFKKAKATLEKQAFAFLMNHPNGFLELLKAIPKYETSFFVSSHQSYLWNEMLRRVIKSKLTSSLTSYPGVAGEYIFYTNLNKQECDYFKKLNIPLPGNRPKVEDALTRDIYMQVLAENGIKSQMFNKVKIRKVFFKALQRKAITRSEDLNYEFLNDEIYTGKRKLCLKFSLSRGSYATMFIKRIFACK
jgi:tRNA pseudouridine13 synthase